MFYDNKTYVIKTKDLAKVVKFFGKFGLWFELEKHGDGPQHFSCEREGWVLEIYPK
jgi:hypothetical protein